MVNHITFVSFRHLLGQLMMYPGSRNHVWLLLLVSLHLSETSSWRRSSSVLCFVSRRTSNHQETSRQTRIPRQAMMESCCRSGAFFGPRRSRFTSKKLHTQHPEPPFGRLPVLPANMKEDGDEEPSEENELERLQAKLQWIEALEARNQAQLDSFVDEADQWESLEPDEKELLQSKADVLKQLEALTDGLIGLWMGQKIQDG